MQVLHEAIAPPLELNLGDYNVNGASIGCGRDGTKFAFTIRAVSDATVTALERAAETRGSIRLLLPRPLLLDLVALERKGPDTVRIVGRIVDGISDAIWRAAFDERPRSERRSVSHY
jgi:hypothetical protein